MTEIEINRNTHGIDPGLHFWGWEIPVYLFLGGLAAGLMIISAIASRSKDEQSRWLRWMPLGAPIILSIGMFALFLDLEYKLHVWRFYTAFRVTSPMSWGSWILLAIYPAAILFLLARLDVQELARIRALPLVRRFASMFDDVAAFASRHERRLMLANVLLGIALGAYTGVLLSTLGARALWSSSILAPLFLVSGFSTAAALVMLFPLKHEEHARIRNWDIAAIAVEIVLIMLFFVGLATSANADAHSAAQLFFGGGYTAAFWSIVFVAGLAVPLFIESYEASRRVRATVVAPLLLLAGGFALRWILVAAGQAM